MKIIDPIALTDAHFQWSTLTLYDGPAYSPDPWGNVPAYSQESFDGFVVEVAPALWDANTIYKALGSGIYATEFVGVALGYGYVGVYKNLVDFHQDNVGHYPPTSPQLWRFVGGTYQEYDATAVYALGERAQNSTTHKVYESLVEGQTGTTTTSPPVWGGGGSTSYVPTAPTAPPVVTVTNSTLLDDTKWLPVGATNWYAMFDLEQTTKTAWSQAITVVAKSLRANSIALYGLQGRNLRIDLVDADTLVGLASNIFWTSGDVALDESIILDVADWLDVPPVPVDSVSFTDVTPASGWFRVVISGPGEVTCGSLITGDYMNLGDTEYGASFGFTDYGQKEWDKWGGYTYSKGTYSDKVNVSTFFDNADLAAVAAGLKKVRGKPCGYIATDIATFRPLNVLGVFKDFSVVVKYPFNSMCSIEIDSLSSN